MFGFFGVQNLTTDLVGPLRDGLARIRSQIGLVVRSSSPKWVQSGERQQQLFRSLRGSRAPKAARARTAPLPRATPPLASSTPGLARVAEAYLQRSLDKGPTGTTATCHI